MLYIEHRERQTKVLGPGTRYAVWVQGCKKRCPNCINPRGRALDSNGYHIGVDELFREIMGTPSLTGITVSGGEPFLQSNELVKLIRLIRAESTLDVMMYSGYTLEELRARHEPSVDEILSSIDLLIAGEYVEELNTNKIYRGSDNQVIHFLSTKYLPFKDRMEAAHNRSVEFVCREDGELFMVGIPAKNFEADFARRLLRE